MANPVVNFADTTFTFTELTNTFGSAFLHDDTILGTITDDNFASYSTTFTHVPDPAVLPGLMEVFIDVLFSNLQNPPLQGDVDVDYSVEDSELDYLRQGVKVVQTIEVTITDTSTGEATTETFTIEITGANDVPTARADTQSTSENTAFLINRVIGNDTDPDIGDTLALTKAGFRIKSVTNTGEKFLTKEMVRISQVNFTNDSLPLKDSIKVELDRAFQGLKKGEKATIVIEYGISDDFGGLSASTFTITVNGDTDKQIVGSKGNDRFLFGESDKDIIDGRAGDDTIDGRGGSDILIGGPGADKLKGGKGTDTASYETAKKGVVASLLKPARNTNDAKGDSYSSIENLTGSNKADTLTGDNGANFIKGLFGDDILSGGGGRDVLEGGLGADLKTGGGGADTFLFRTVSDSLPVKKFMDRIADFSRSQGDRFDLSPIDAKSKSAKDDKFTFIGDDPFSGKAEELRYEKSGKTTVVLGDVNGDGVQDFGFTLAQAIDLVKDDFIL